MNQPQDAEMLPADEGQAKVAADGTPVPETTVVIRGDEHLPSLLIALPLNQRPIFPTMMLPLVIPAGRLADAVRHAIKHLGGYLGFFLTRTALDDGSAYRFEDLLPMGCVARVVKHLVGEDGSVQVFAQVLARFRITGVERTEPVLLVRGEAIRTTVDAADPQVRAYAMAIVAALKELVQHNPIFADEIRLVLANFNHLDGPGRLADIAASLTTAKREEIQLVLEEVEILPRMERVMALLAKEAQLTQLKAKITHQIEEKVSDHQHKFFLNEQLKAIKQELGLETDDKSLDVKKFRDVLAAKGVAMSEEVRDVMEEELRKLQLLDPASSEYGVVRTRLEWLTEMPWGVVTEDDLDLGKLRQGLDRDHYGLEDIKDRIVEFCAVHKLLRQGESQAAAGGPVVGTTNAPAGKTPRPPAEHRRGGMIALVGPPGTGKTSIGASIARNLGRRFFRMSLGGMRDEAEIKGHRRTYVGALPGKLVQAIRRCGSMNPVILLDEVDKMGISHQGDPAAALLEVLDPEQNKDFLDHYLDVRVDLSQVLFICTANELGGIPEPLIDRMEIIRLSGYVESEKQVIARDHLVPKQVAMHGLTRRDLIFTGAALTRLIRDYAREAGVRQLEQLIAKVCRKVATAKARSADRALGGKVREGTAAVRRALVGPADLVKYLGKPLMRDDALINTPVPGVVTGLAWTAMGGATLEVEAVATPADKGGLTLTGQLGDVMKESASLARSYLMSHIRNFCLAPDWFDKHHVHLHVPAGATPKDGPSAGCTMATAMLSLALGRPVKRRLGMTGELTLTGRIYPIGGVREKLVAAKRSGLATVLLPLANERDYDELPEHVRSGLAIVFVDSLDEVLREAGLVTRRGGRVRKSGSPEVRKSKTRGA
jgi:ATP-dependent Lon protease